MARAVRWAPPRRRVPACTRGRVVAMRERFDAQGKDALVALIDDVGAVERGTETGAATQRVDVWFRPDDEHRAERRHRGLLGAMVDEDCDLELFRNTPTVPLV